jgi:hypothetical protein
MTPTTLRTRLLCAGSALTITLVLFQAIATFARPTALEQMASADRHAMTVAVAR